VILSVGNVGKQTYEEQLISQIKMKEEEISDLQIQHQEFQKFIEKAGEEVINKLKNAIMKMRRCLDG